MAGFSTDKDRKVIPRWRTLDQTLRLGELNSLMPPQDDYLVPSGVLESKIMDWLEHQTVGHAADLVGASLTLGRETEATKAARFLLRGDHNASPWALELAERALADPKVTDLVPVSTSQRGESRHGRVRILRQLLRKEPRDPITWVELSLAYAILGLGNQAERTMTVGLQLAKDNRFVLRAASRLWVHRKDPEKAHDIIVRAERTPFDPWLMAAEIAIGSIDGRKPRFVKAARRILEERRFSPVHISELASAMATLEFNHGNVKRSRQLFDISLRNPTENSIAQAAWASRQNSSIRIDDEYLDRPNTFEARAWSFYHRSQWKQVIEECRLWNSDQPFSSRPSVLASYVAAVALEDYEASISFAEPALKANPSNVTLLNNFAFASICRSKSGDVERARKALSNVDHSHVSRQELVALKATRGFLAFRTGNVSAGDRLYAEARSEARRMQDSRLLALASAFHVIAEYSHKPLEGSSGRFDTLPVLRRETDPIFRVLERRLTKIVKEPKCENNRGIE